MNPRPANAIALPVAIAAATRARMNSIQCRCSSREISQKLTSASTTIATIAVMASSSSRFTGAMSIRNVARTHVRTVANSAATMPHVSGRR